MTRRLVGALTLVLAIVSLAGLPAGGRPMRAVRAQSALTVVTQEHSYSFGQHIRFTAELESETPLTQVTLLFAEADDVRIFSADLPVPGDRTELQVTYTLDLKEYPLRPYARVEYWWQAENRDGARLESERMSFIYADNRYDWLEVAEEGIAVHHAVDEPTLGHTALRVAKEGLARMADLLPTPLDEPINIYIYPTAEELRSALRLGGREWVGGHADVDWSVILVSSNGSPTSLLALQSTIPHELAHLVVHHVAGSHNEVPAWLHEGLAVRNEPRPDPTFGIALEEALAKGTLLTVESLCTSFPTDEATAVQAYAQSASVVRYLQNQYGNQALKELLVAYGDGADCNGGVQRVLGLSLGELERAWLADLRGQTEAADGPEIDTEGVLPWIGLLGGGTVLATSLYWLRPGRRGRRSHEETPETRF